MNRKLESIFQLILQLKIMSEDILKGKWEQIKGYVQKEWGSF